jgi:hypothetical protein
MPILPVCLFPDALRQSRGLMRSWFLPQDACGVAVDATMPDHREPGELGDAAMRGSPNIRMAGCQTGRKNEGTAICFIFFTLDFHNYEIDCLV